MEKSLWDRMKELDISVSGANQLDNIQLSTRTFKISLGMFLLQSILVSLIWSIKSSSLSPWFIVVSTTLQIGWIWNKVTEYWKNVNNLPIHSPLNNLYDSDEDTTLLNPPNIIIQPVNLDHPLADSNAN